MRAKRNTAVVVAVSHVSPILWCACRQQSLVARTLLGGFAGVELIGGINDFTRGMLPFYANIPPHHLR
jgi:hypothetical protein